MAQWFYRAMHREPVVMWSCFLGGVGMALPLIVPRDLAMGASSSSASSASGASSGVPSAASVAAALKPGGGSG